MLAVVSHLLRNSQYSIFKDNKKSISFYSGLVGNIGHHKLTAINVVIKAFQVTEAATNKLPEIITNITSPLNKRQLVNALLDCLHLIRKIIKDKYYYINIFINFYIFKIVLSDNNILVQ